MTALAIDRTTLKPVLLDHAGQGSVLFVSGRTGIGTPRVKPAGIDTQTPTHQSNRVLLHLIFDESVPYPDCGAKYATAF
jgi:hypothetical protein